jgi:hypothetical protein
MFGEVWHVCLYSDINHRDAADCHLVQQTEKQAQVRRMRERDVVRWRRQLIVK